MDREREEPEDENNPEQINKDVFAPYMCNALPFAAHPHPGDIAEATSLSSVPLPPTNYPLLDAIPHTLVDSGKLSQLQIEGILYACHKHCNILQSGKRAGFFIGDGAGVGKGRQIAGCIIDSYARGRKQHAWLSISSDLHLDAQRDLTDLGCYIKVINNVQTLDRETKALGLSSEFKEGVLFLTYSSLISVIKGKSRLDQIVNWLGGESFDGLLVFDECHKAKNFTPGKEAASTKIAANVLELQQRLPMARVLYASATGVSEVGNMAYMERMALWGPGTAFKDFEQFLSQMKNRGVSFLELLAMEMKAEGKYVARGLSFKDAEFSEIESFLTPEQTRIYDAAVQMWRKVKTGLHSALVYTANSSRDVMKVYWATVQRFFKLLCVSLKIPRIVAEAKQALAEDYSVVIGLQSTGEAADASLQLQPGPVPGYVSTTKAILTSFVEKHIPLAHKEKGKGKDGQEQNDNDLSSEMGDGEGSNAGADDPLLPDSLQVWQDGKPSKDCVARECKAIQRELLDAIGEMYLPENFLDKLLAELGGPSKVAEMTGRSGRIVYDPRRDAFNYELRAKTDSSELDSLNVVERTHFMKDKKRVAIISDAASTGISLHASAASDCAHPRRRIHLTIELPWSADKAIQQLGRTHRSNQVSAPVYKLISTNVGGEKRFAAAVARRLQSLGALTRGDRRAASGVDLSEQNFDSPLGRRSLRRMYDHILAELDRLPMGADYVAVLKESVKAESGRLDMDDAEAEALIRMEDPDMRGMRIALLHKQLREYVDIMGVDVSTSKKDTVAEEGEPATGNGRGRDKGNTSKAKDSPSKKGGKETGDVRRFLNRLLCLPVAEQNLLFSYFTAVLAAEITAAKQEGKFSEGLCDLFSSHQKKQGVDSGGVETILWTDPGVDSGGVERTILWTDPVSRLRTYQNDFYVDRGMSFETAKTRLQLEAVPGDLSGFRISRRPNLTTGQHMVCLALQKPGARNVFGICRPNTGESYLDMSREEVEDKYHSVSTEKAEVLWQSAYEYSLDNCTHGVNCKQGDSCTSGKRITPVTVLSGSVVRVWGVLEAVLSRHEHTLSKADRTMRVVRAELGPKLSSPSAAQTPNKAAAAGTSTATPLQSAAQAVLTAAAGTSTATPASQVLVSLNSDTPPPPSLDVKAEADTAGNATPAGVPKTDKIVGVRYPAALLSEVVATLQSLLQTALDKGMSAAAQAATISALSETGVPAASLSGRALGGENRESPRKVDPKALARAFRKPPTMTDFFKKTTPAPSTMPPPSMSDGSTGLPSPQGGVQAPASHLSGLPGPSTMAAGTQVKKEAGSGSTQARGAGSSGTQAKTGAGSGGTQARGIGNGAGSGRGSGGAKQASTSGNGKGSGRGKGKGKAAAQQPGQRSLKDSFFGKGKAQPQQQQPAPEVDMVDMLSDSSDGEGSKGQEKRKREGDQDEGHSPAAAKKPHLKAETTQNTTNGSSKDDLLQQLVGMGFETRQAERALLLARNEEGGMSLNKAVEMCLQGM